MVTPESPVTEIAAAEGGQVPIEHVDISLEPVALEKLIKESEPHGLGFPSMLLPAAPNVERLKILPASISSSVAP